MVGINTECVQAVWESKVETCRISLKEAEFQPVRAGRRSRAAWRVMERCCICRGVGYCYSRCSQSWAVPLYLEIKWLGKGILQSCVLLFLCLAFPICTLTCEFTGLFCG